MKNDSREPAKSPTMERTLRYSKPTKEAVRGWLLGLIAARRPPPAMKEIQDDLWYSPRSQGMKDGP